MNDLEINYILPLTQEELGYKFPEEEISLKIRNEIITDPLREVREKFVYDNILDKMIDQDSPFWLQFKSLEQTNRGNFRLTINVRDKIGKNIPRLIPEGKSWFVVGTTEVGGFKTCLDVHIKVDECDDIYDLCRSFRRNYLDEYDFEYLCVFNEKLEIVDWNSFYEWNNSEELQKFLEEITNYIASGKYKALLKKR